MFDSNSSGSIVRRHQRSAYIVFKGSTATIDRAAAHIQSSRSFCRAVLFKDRNEFRVRTRFRRHYRDQLLRTHVVTSNASTTTLMSTFAGHGVSLLNSGVTADSENATARITKNNLRAANRTPLVDQ